MWGTVAVIAIAAVVFMAGFEAAVSHTNTQYHYKIAGYMSFEPTITIQEVHDRLFYNELDSFDEDHPVVKVKKED